MHWIRTGLFLQDWFPQFQHYPQRRQARKIRHGDVPEGRERGSAAARIKVRRAALKLERQGWAKGRIELTIRCGRTASRLRAVHPPAALSFLVSVRNIAIDQACRG
jgi:hypothetical protein